MSNGLDISIFLKMAGDLAKPMKDAESKIKASTDRMKKSMSLSLKLAGAGAVAAGIKMATRGMISNFTEGVREVQRATGDLRSLGMKDMTAIIAEGQRLQNTYVGLTTEAFVRAAYDIKSGVSTLSDEGVAAMTSAALKVAKATKGIPENMTSLFATSYGIFKKQFSEMSDADWGDMFGAALSKSVQAFKTDGAKMQSAIESAGAGASNLGMKMTEQMTLLGMMQQQMQAGEAGTALRAFATNAAKAHEAFGAMKITTDRPVRVRILDENGQLRSMPDVLTDLKDRYGETLDAFEAAEIKKAFGTDEAMKMINALYGQEEAVRANAAALEDAARQGAEFTESMAANVDDYDGADWELFQQQMETIKEQIGAGLLPAMDKLAPAFANIAQGIGDFITRNPELVAGLAAAIVGLSGLATVAMPVFFAISSLTATFAGLRHGSVLLGAVLRGTGTKTGLLARGVKLLGGAFGILKVAILGIGRVLMANPIGLAIAVIAGGAYLIYKNWEPIKVFFSNLWSSVKTFTANAWEGIKSTFLNYTPHGLIIKHWDSISDWFSGLWGRVKSGTSTAWEGIKAGFLNYTPHGLIIKHWEGISDWFSGLWGRVKSGTSTAWEGIKTGFLNYTPHGLIIKHWEGVAEWFSNLWGRIKSGAVSAWDGIKSFFSSISWLDVLPDWDWSAIIPDFPDLKSMFSDTNETIDVRLEARATTTFGEWDRGLEMVKQYREGLMSLSDIQAELSAKANSEGDAWIYNSYDVNRAQEMLALLQEIETAPTPSVPEISNPETLLAAAQAAEQLTTAFPALTVAANEALMGVQAVITQMSAEIQSVDMADKGARLMRSLADGIRSQIANVTAATRRITAAIRAALPKSASLSVSVSGTGTPVQARAGGGSYGSGWLLTGEQGPELRYANEGGFIAHNGALRGMLDMATKTRSMLAGSGLGGFAQKGMTAIGSGAIASAVAAGPGQGMPSTEQIASSVQATGKTVSITSSDTINITISGEFAQEQEERLRMVLADHERNKQLEQERFLND